MMLSFEGLKENYPDYIDLAEKPVPAELLKRMEMYGGVDIPLMVECVNFSPDIAAMSDSFFHNQPKTWDVFLKGGVELLRGICFVDDPMDPFTIIDHFLGNRQVGYIMVDSITPKFTYAGESDRYDAIRDFPPELVASWFLCTGSWKQPSSDHFKATTASRPIVKHPWEMWPPIELFAPSFVDEKGRVGSARKVSGDAAALEALDRLGLKVDRVRCFLDSRPPQENGYCGQQLFVDAFESNGKVYCVRDGKLATIVPVSDPVARIDDYSAHLLSGHASLDFDFLA